MTETQFCHDGMRALQDRFDGRRLADVLAAVRRHDLFSPDDVSTIEAASFFMIATSHADQPDCSVRAGDPGSVRVTGPDSIEVPDCEGNSMYRTLGNIARNPRVGCCSPRSTGPAGCASTDAPSCTMTRRRWPCTTARAWSCA